MDTIGYSDIPSCYQYQPSILGINGTIGTAGNCIKRKSVRQWYDQQAFQAYTFCSYMKGDSFACCTDVFDNFTVLHYILNFPSLDDGLQLETKFSNVPWSFSGDKNWREQRIIRKARSNKAIARKNSCRIATILEWTSIQLLFFVLTLTYAYCRQGYRSTGILF